MFQFLKKADNLRDLLLKSIELPNGGYLCPATSLTDPSIHPSISESLSKENEIIFYSTDKTAQQTNVLFHLKHTPQTNEIELVETTVITQDDSEIAKQALSEWVRTILGIPAEKRPTLLSKPKKNIGDTMILTAGPSISQKEIYYTYDAAKNGWNNQWSGYLKKFEEAFKDYIGVKYALPTSSCTGGLHLALLTLGIGPGDEVIVPDTTWVSSANAIMYVGATPIFADIDPHTWCLDPESFESLITENTKAVIPVHLYGHPADMDPIMAIANKYNLKVVEDAAPSIGASYNGKKTGSFGDFASFSFQGAKLAVTGEGGILVTNNEELYKKAYTIWDQGRTPGTFWINELGWKYKMSNVQAALGLAQIERCDELVTMKHNIFSWYDDELKGVEGISLNYEAEGCQSIYWMSSIYLDPNGPISRDDMITKLKERNIDTRPVFPAISQYPFWPKKQDPKPVAKRVGEQAINLPSGVCLSEEEVRYVARNVKEIWENNG